VKKNWAIIVLCGVLFLGCEKKEKSSLTPPDASPKKAIPTSKRAAAPAAPSTQKKVTLRQRCSVFVPPWGEKHWETWGRKHPKKFELWYGKIRLQLRKADLSILPQCTHITSLFLGFSPIRDLSPLQKLTQLKKLDLRFARKVNDLSPLQKLSQLEYLNIWKTGVTDLTPIAKLPRLKRIDAKMTRIQDISPLKTLRSLESIDLLRTPVKEIKVFAHLPNLREVRICTTQVTRLDPIYPKAEQITYLDLCNTKFRRFRHLKKFKNLRALKLWGLPLRNARLFRQMKHLEVLDLWNTKVRDIRPLYSLKKLKKLVLIGLKVPPHQIKKIKQRIPGLKVITRRD
jgi:Leucine-rich repeat (LRR) protein